MSHNMAWRGLFLAVTAFFIMAGTALATDYNATPSNFSSVFASAQGGDTIHLASGNYGSFNGGSKSSMVTITAQAGATPTMSGGNFGSSVRNITIKGVRFTGGVEVTPGSTPLNLIFDGDDWGNAGHAAHEGRLSIIGGGSNAIDSNGVQVKNSTFGPGGCADGIQDSSNGTEIGPGNEFKGIVQGSCAEHADAIQPYASNYVWIHDNYMHDNEQGIMSPDGISVGYLIENNVIHTSTGYPCMHLGHTTNGTVRHNVCRNGSIRLFGGNENVPSSGMTVRDNVADIWNQACNGCTIDHNLAPSAVTFTGGSGRCAYATASPKGTASDRTDIGLNDCGATPPPTDTDGDGVPDSTDLCPGTPAGTPVDSSGCPFGPPPTDHTPVASFTDSPNPSVPQQSVTFNATASTCVDTPCKYHWHDVGQDGTGDWGLGPDGSTMSFAFQGTGTKYIELVLTDVDGDVSKVMHPHTVSASPPPVDNKPVARFTYSPASPSRGQQVTFDATTTTCGDAPCTYVWQDDGPDGPGGTNWPLGSGATLKFTFQGAGVKYVRVTATDVDGDTSTVTHNVTVR